MHQVGSRGRQSAAARNEHKGQAERDKQKAELQAYAKPHAQKNAASNAKKRGETAAGDRRKQEAEMHEIKSKADRDRQKKELKAFAGMAKIMNDYKNRK